MNNHKAIHIQDLYKDFGDIQAVNGASFDVQMGEIFRLLGPNGAGKSTTISMLACLSDHIAIMDQGKIIAYGTHEALVKIVGELDRVDLTLNTPAERVIEAWREIEGEHKITSENGTVTLRGI